MNIPPQAKRVFKGVIFDVYQWEQKMFDGSTETFEMLKRPDTVQVIPVVGNKILIAEEQQPGDQWRGAGLFGGRVDEGEDALTAAKRELLEETGFASDDWEQYKVYEPHHKFEWRVYYFVARGCRKIGEPKPDPGEKIEIKEVGFDEFMALASSSALHAGEFTSDMLRLAADPTRLSEFKKKFFFA